MTDRDALYRAVLEHPDADPPRLVYADWLEEHGDLERATFIRQQVENAGLPEWDRRSHRHQAGSEAAEGYDLRLRENLLRGLQGVHWDPTGYRRGFPCHFRADSAKAVLDQAEQLWSRMPLESLDLGERSMDGWKQLVESPWMRKLRALEVTSIPLNESFVRPLLESPHAVGLRRLRHFWSPATAEGLRLLLSSAFLGRLSELDLGLRNGLGELIADASAHVKSSGQLSSLGLSATGLTADHLRAVLESPLGTRLKTIWAGGNPLGDAGFAVVGGTSTLAGLEVLRLYQTQPRLAGMRSLAQSRHLSRLRVLDLRQNNLGPASAKLLAESAALSHLTVLDLCRNHVADRGVAAIVRSPFLGGLAVLDLSANRITDAGAKVLLDSPLLAEIVRLHLSDNNITPKMQRKLRRRFGHNVWL